MTERIEVGYVWVNRAGGCYWGVPFGGGFKRGIQ